MARKADIVAQDLLSRIVTGDLEVGSLLPKEGELAEEYAVNRSVIREAVKLLEVHRLVRPVRRRGTEVLSPVASLSPEVLRTMLLPRPGYVDASALADFLQIRAVLDEEMAALAATHRTDEDLAAMDEVLQEMREALPEPHRYVKQMGALSLWVARATQNRVYEMLVHWHRTVQRDLEDLFLTVWLATEQHLQGQEILVGLLHEGAADRARTLVRAYHHWATPRLLAAAALYSGREPDADFEGRAPALEQEDRE